VAGGVYFFTVNLADRRCNLLTREIEGLRAAVRKMRARLLFRIDAWVVLPDYLHCMWTLPEGDRGFSARWHAIKAGFSKSVPGGEARSASRIGKGERGFGNYGFGNLRFMMIGVTAKGMRRRLCASGGGYYGGGCSGRADEGSRA
jgi:REP element-mobilizing transposase RayT